MPRYETHRFEAVLDFLDKNRNEMGPILERRRVENLLKAGGMTDLAKSASDPELTAGIGEHFRNRLRAEAVVTAIDRLREVRDKVLAHNERIAVVRSPSWTAVIELVALAKDLIGVIGRAYLARVYVWDDGAYVTDTDAHRPSSAMERLLQQLGIVPDPHPRPELH